MHRLSNRLIPAVGLCLLVSSQMANAGQNRVYIEQSGVSNSLFIDQTEAEGSTVGGLTILHRDVDVVDPVTKNNLHIDSLGFVSANAAVQSGDGNIANVTISGSGGTVRLYQSNPNPSLGNTATVNLDGGELAAIGQVGFGNTALLTVNGSDASGTVLQSGNDNIANLTVGGSGASGLISQVGNNNDTTLVVGGVNTSISYVVEGNGISPSNPQQGVQVLSNAGSVSITQTFFGGN